MAWKYSYEEMLEAAYKEISKISVKTSRFEMPKFIGSVQGNRTIISNIMQVAKYLRRPYEHLMKFLLRELATTGTIEHGRAVFMGRFSSAFLNSKLEKYVKEFVLCSQCGKPDTKLIKERGISFKKCEACGARSSVRTLK